MHLDLKSEQCPPPFTCNDIANVVNPFIRREIFAKSRYRPRSKVRKAKGGTLEKTFFYPCINLPFARGLYLFFGTFGRFLLN